jgi:hypothetical protein
MSETKQPIKFTLDGREVEAPTGETISAPARRYGIRRFICTASRTAVCHDHRFFYGPLARNNTPRIGRVLTARGATP